MKNLIFILLVTFFIISCENSNDVRNDLTRLKNERMMLYTKIDSLKDSINIYQLKNDSISDVNNQYEFFSKNKSVRFFLKLRIYQSHMSLDISSHIKDRMNEIEMIIPVDKEYYNSVRIGDKIKEEFRMVSFIMSGSFGDWNIEVIEKIFK